MIFVLGVIWVEVSPAPLVIWGDFGDLGISLVTCVIWVIWVMWWTLLGQVNGIQTCFEGICPHPRELDPGAVVVQGGYFGGGEQPSTSWMTMMVASPLIVASVALMFSIRNAGYSLLPYMLSQFVIVFGCLNLYAYSPIYPRLIFSLTYNILFAMAQFAFAGTAVLIYNRVYLLRESRTDSIVAY